LNQKNCSEFSFNCFPGIPKRKINEFTKRRDPRGDGSSKGIKKVDSLWGSIKNFLRYILVVLYANADGTIMNIFR